MDSAFIAVFIVALVFSVFFFLVAEEDFQRKSERSIYFLIIVMVAWPVSLSLMQAPATATYNTTITGVPLNCVINSANAIPANYPSVVSCGTTNETSVQVVEMNEPFPAWAFYAYMTFSLGMTLIFIVFFVKYMITFGLQMLLDSMHGKKRGGGSGF